jgi:TP901 family phage tail tape measure protein
MTDFANLVLGVNTSQLKRGERDLKQFGAQSDRTSGKVDKFGGSAKRSFNAVAIAATAALGAIVSIGSAVRIIAEFETSMSRLGAVSRATSGELEALRDIAKDLGSTTEFSASQAADGLNFLAMAGFNATEAMAAIPSVLDLATASGMGLAAAADTASNIMSGFGIEASNAAQVADVLAAASTRANTTVGQLGAAMSTVAPIASALDMSLEDTAAAIGVLSDAGIQGERAGTGLRGVLAALAGPTTQAEAVIRGLGLTIADVDPATNDLSEVMAKLGAAGLSTADAMTVFGREAASGALVLIDGAQRVGDFGDELARADGAAGDMAATMRDNLGGDLKGAMSAAQGLAIALGDAGLTAIIRSVVHGVTALSRGLTAMVDSAAALGEFVGGLFTYSRGMDQVQRSADVANLAIADELTQVNALSVAMQGGVTMSRQSADLALIRAKASLVAADAIRQENIEMAKSSPVYLRMAEDIQKAQLNLLDAQELARDLDSSGLEGLEYTAGLAARNIETMAAELRAVVAEQEQVIAAADVGSQAFNDATKAVADLETAIALASGDVVVLGGEVQTAADTTAALARLASGVNFDTAAQSARRMSDELGIALGTALRISAMTSASRVGVSGPDSAIASLQNEGRLGGGPLQGIVGTLNVGPRFNPTSGGGGTSDAERAAKKLRNDNQRELEQITNGLATAQDKYNAGLGQAQRLLQADVLGPDVYAQHVAQLRQELTDAEWADSGLKPFIDDLSQAGLSMESLADVFQNAIARMAQSWLSSGLTSLGQSFMGIGGGAQGGGIISGLIASLPSFSGGGSTGNGSRSGGLDGQGGFAAMLHPQETVTDHTRGQSSSQAPVINITVNGARGNAEIVEMVGIGVSAGIQQNNKRIATAQGRPT